MIICFFKKKLNQNIYLQDYVNVVFKMPVWNDDERDISDMPIYHKSEYVDEFIHIHKILKELYEEENDIMYINLDPSDPCEDFEEEYYDYDDEYYSDDEYEINSIDSEEDYESRIEDIGDYFENLVYNKFYYY